MVASCYPSKSKYLQTPNSPDITTQKPHQNSAKLRPVLIMTGWSIVIVKSVPLMGGNDKMSILALRNGSINFTPQEYKQSGKKCIQPFIKNPERTPFEHSTHDHPWSANTSTMKPYRVRRTLDILSCTLCRICRVSVNRFHISGMGQCNIDLIIVT